jgi:O-antigen ligase
MMLPNDLRVSMPRSYRFDYRIFLVIFVAVIFGLLLNAFLPLFARNPHFLLALPGAAAFFLFLIVWPKQTLVLLLLVRPLLDNMLVLSKISTSGTQFSLGAGFNLAVLILAVFMAFYLRGFPRQEPMVRWWVLYLLVVVAATCYSPYFGQAVRLFLNQLTYLSMFLIPFFLVKERKDFLFWLKILGISFILPLMWGNLDFVFWHGKFYEDTGQRILGSFSHPNILGFYMVLGLTVYFYILKSDFYQITPRVKLIMMALMANMLVILFATKTRNAWIAGFVGFCLYGFLRDKQLLYKILIAAVLAFLFVPAIQQRIMSVLEPPKIGEYQGINSFKWRLEMWKSSLSWIAKRPLTGYGLTSFKPLSAQFSTVGTNGAHNVYLELMFDSGIFGVLTFIPLFFVPLMVFYRQMCTALTRTDSHLYAILVGYVFSYLLICTSDNLLYYLALNWYVWFFFGLMFVDIRLKKNVQA